jgi:hypothetical protein
MPSACGLGGATTRTGGASEQPDRRGASRCRLHVGNSPQAQHRAHEVVAQAIAAGARHYGAPRNASAIDVPVEEFSRRQSTSHGSESRLRRDRRAPACLPCTPPSAAT